MRMRIFTSAERICSHEFERSSISDNTYCKGLISVYCAEHLAAFFGIFCIFPNFSVFSGIFPYFSVFFGIFPYFLIFSVFFRIVFVLFPCFRYFCIVPYFMQRMFILNIQLINNLQRIYSRILYALDLEYSKTKLKKCIFNFLMRNGHPFAR